MKTKSVLPAPELSRPLIVDKIPAGGVEDSIVATEAERQKLAERFGLLEVSALKAKLDVRRDVATQGLLVTGRMEADVVQQCVATLEPLPAHIEHEITTLFAPELDDSEELPVEDSEVEAITDGAIDLGELVAQNLGIALDPYPRKAGVGFVQAEYGGTTGAAGPLAKLADWKKPKE